MRKLIFLICPLFLIYVLFFLTVAGAFSYERPIREKLLQTKVEDISNLNPEYAFYKLEQIYSFEREEFEEKEFLLEYKLKPRKSKDVNEKYALSKIEGMVFEKIEKEDDFSKLIIDALPKNAEVKKENVVVEKQGEVKLTLSILPVRFVYFDNNGNIVKIWNNVQKGHDVYVLKFFNFEDNSELELTTSSMVAYSNLLVNLDMFAQGYIYERDYEAEFNGAWDVSLEYTNEGGVEIYTYI